MSSNDSIIDLLREVQALTEVTELDDVLRELQDGVDLMSIPSSPHLKDPEALVPILIEHARDCPDGRQVISAPIQVLQTRLLLLKHEARQVLDALVANGTLEPSVTWDEAVLPFNVERAATIREQGERWKKKSAAVEKTGGRVTGREWAWDEPRKPREPKSEERQRASLTDVYAKLLDRATTIDDKRFVRGAVPYLQMEYQIGAEEVILLLDTLLRDGHVEQVDGWRSIRLCSDAAEGTAAIEFEPGRASRAATRRMEQPQLRVVRTDPDEPQRFGMATARAEHLLETAVDALEHRLELLRALHGELSVRIGTLEGSLSALRDAKERHAATELSAKEAMEQVAEANADLRRILRLGGAG